MSDYTESIAFEQVLMFPCLAAVLVPQADKEKGKGKKGGDDAGKKDKAEKPKEEAKVLGVD